MFSVICLISLFLCTWTISRQHVLQRLLDSQLFVKAEKCELHASTLSFLGFVVSGDSIQMDPAKVSAVVDLPTPISRKLVQHFLGFAYFYRRLICNFSTIAAPLHALTSPQVPFQWSPQADCLSEAKRELYLGTHPHTSRHQSSICGGGACLRRGHWGGPFSVVPGQ